MKTTIDLPADLVREIKIQAVRDGRKLKDAVTEMLRASLNARTSKARSTKGAKKISLPTIKCRHGAASGAEITPARAAEILLKQEVSWNADARR